jgi:preprotein translocase subunit SecB
MTNEACLFEIQDCRLRSVNFDVNKASAPKKQAEVTIEVNLEHDYNDKDNLLNLIMGVDIIGKDFLNISIKYEGIFKFNKKPKPKDNLSKTAEITCASILFPFVRESVADFTRRAGLPPLILDPMNFVEFYDDNHQKGAQ